MSISLLLQLPNTFRAFYGAFPGLHSAQEKAVAPILAGRDLVLQAATGAGKTEAVLAPCMERVITSGRKTAILYIIPTRALAMDLKRRFESVITERLGLNLAIRTGDIKRAGGRRPDIMFTTPESLDVMIGSANPDLTGFLSRVGTIIIDEVHPLLHQYRGQHLVYLLTRLERRTGRTLQKIAMSATIARVSSVIDFFGFRADTQHIITNVNRKIAARLLHIKREEYEIPALLNDLYNTWHYRKILFFANSRSACDRLFGIVDEPGRFQGVAELHYSNLKPGERKKAEKRFRKSSCALCIATSTLELGIDVGDVDAVLLYEPPGSVSAFLQRIGRANRREKQINFWGLCCGENAGAQVIRFLALLELARRGIIESLCDRNLPSVLSQQVISCLYEKKRISLPSLQSLFPDQYEILPSVFASLEQKKWLKQSKIDGLTHGGWQYRKHLFDYQIWGNFPKSEEEYVLYMEDKAIADIPQSIVSQMEAGDEVFIVGRLLKIVEIDAGEQKKIFAKPATGQDTKRLVWVGWGIPISYDLAQEMGRILKTDEIKDKTCLFTRTKKLFCKEIEQEKKKIVLKNGIEIVPGEKTAFHYRTFAGSAGNLVLEWCIRDKFDDADDIIIESGSMGIECSHWINFQDINLPVTREELQFWVTGHLKILGSVIPLNMFCKTLPEDLLVEELTSFLFDNRVAQTFARYRDTTSEIISGDKADLVLENTPLTTPVEKTPETCAIDIIPGASLLEMEKAKAKKNEPGKRQDLFYTDQCRRFCPDSNFIDSNKLVYLTAAMIGDYFFHGQCERQFRFKFLNFDRPAPILTTTNDHDIHVCDIKDHDLLCHDSPPNDNLCDDTSGNNILTNDKLRSTLINRRIMHEKQVIEHLKKQGETIIIMPVTGSYDRRFKVFLNQLKALVVKLRSRDNTQNLTENMTNGYTKDITGNIISTKSVFLSQCFLKVDNPISKILETDHIETHRMEANHLKSDNFKSNKLTNDHLNIIGTGVPDLLILSVEEFDGEKRVVISAGDIKSGNYPGYHHRWKVAFNALLLKKIIHLHGISAMISETGFFITPSSKKNMQKTGQPQKSPPSGSSCQEPFILEKHEFDLKPYLSAFPALFKTMFSLLSRPASAAVHRLQSHCVSCSLFLYCYRNALENEDIQFLPGLTHGELFKLRRIGCSDIVQTHTILEKLTCDDRSYFQDLDSVRDKGNFSEKRNSNRKGLPGGKKGPRDRETPEDREYFKGMEKEFTLEQQRRLLGHCRAFTENRIFLHKKNTRLFPDNISRAVFIHTKQDPCTGLPSVLGLQVIDSSATPVASRVWIIKNHLNRAEAWQEFTRLILNLWEKSILNGKGPHIFHFGSRSRQDILKWGNMENGKRPEFLWETQPCPWTDLQRVFKDHFFMPVPGILSLFSLGHVFGCHPGIHRPETLFHYNGHGSIRSCQDLHATKNENYALSCKKFHISGSNRLKFSRPESTKTESTKTEHVMKSEFSIMVNLYLLARSYLKSQWTREWEINFKKEANIVPFLRFIKEEQRLQEDNILTLRELSLRERILRFRAIGYLSFDHTRLDHEGRFLYILKTSMKNRPSKFRKGDFLKLVPHNIPDIQNGFPVIMVENNLEAGEISLLSGAAFTSGRMHLNKNILYSLEEDINNRNNVKLEHAANAAFAGNNKADFLYRPHSLHSLLTGLALARQPNDSMPWLAKWLEKNDTGLNSFQLHALTMPFQYRTSMIQGPPGTGKTHLLGWILITLIMQAHEAGKPLRIGVTALTHQAINTVLEKVIILVNRYFPDIFPGHCIKWGQANKDVKADFHSNLHANIDDARTGKNMEVKFINHTGDADDALNQPWLIIGATGYGFYNLFNSKNRGFPQTLDWVIFDEASQVPVPQALLSLLYSKGNFLFTGDVNQLPPIVLGDYGKINENSKPDNNIKYSGDTRGLCLNQSILANFLNIYPESHSITLNTTYRMNKEICAFPNRIWYKNILHPDTSVANARLALNKPLYGSHKIIENARDSGRINKYDAIIDPEKPVVLVLADHKGCSFQSDFEADIMAAIAHRLMVFYGISHDRIALISPHRAQNNAIIDKLNKKLKRKRLQLPLVDTVERVQGAERDVIIMGMTSSDPDSLLTDFLNNPNRLNVAMTRARTKLIVIGSNALFSIIPSSESMLKKNGCFKELLIHAQKQNAVFQFRKFEELAPPL